MINHCHLGLVLLLKIDTFTGSAPVANINSWKLFATDPYNASASTNVSLLATVDVNDVPSPETFPSPQAFPSPKAFPSPVDFASPKAPENFATKEGTSDLGALVGGIIGGVLGLGPLIGLGYLGYFLYRKFRSTKKDPIIPKPVPSGVGTDPFPNSNLLPLTVKIDGDSSDSHIIPLVDMTYKEKSWHFDPKTKANEIAEDKIYDLIEATDRDKRKVIDFYQHHEVPGYDIASVRVIYNPGMNHKFALYLKELQQRDQNQAFVAKWPEGQENTAEPVESQDNIDWRHEVHQQFEAMAKPYQDSDYPAVKLLPMWHGTKKAIVDSIFRSGYANLATTDNGFFGKGIYGAHEAEYSYRVYAKEGGALILNWTASFLAYPVIDGDMDKFVMKNKKGQNVSIGNYSNYDAHFVPVVPRNPDNDLEEVYYPTKPNQPNQYIELVIFQSAACLPRYLVELQPNLLKSISLSTKSGSSGVLSQSDQLAQNNPPQQSTLSQNVVF